MLAIKEIPIAGLKPQQIDAISSEFDLLSRFNHPNVVQLVSLIKTEKAINFVMEFIEGGSLLDVVLKFGSSLPESLVRKYSQQAFVGLEYIHGQGFIHRDIKASNLLITKSGTIKIADFGISMSVNSASPTNIE